MAPMDTPRPHQPHPLRGNGREAAIARNSRRDSNHGTFAHVRLTLVPTPLDQLLI